MGGQATKNASVYQAAVAHNNEIVAKQNADYAIAAGEKQAQDVSLKGAVTGGKLKTMQAASGLDVNKGSPVDVRVGQAEASKLDAETTLNNAALQAYGYRTQATNFEAEGALDKAKGDQALTGAEIGATGSLLSNASSVGFKWNQMLPGGGDFGGSPEGNPNLVPI